MPRANIIRAALADGVRMTPTPRGTIQVAGDRAAVTRWLPTIRAHKPEILAVLKSLAYAERAERGAKAYALALQNGEAFEERSAIRECDGGYSRQEAERRARIDLAMAEPWGRA